MCGHMHFKCTHQLRARIPDRQTEILFCIVLCISWTFTIRVDWKIIIKKKQLLKEWHSKTKPFAIRKIFVFYLYIFRIAQNLFWFFFNKWPFHCITRNLMHFDVSLTQNESIILFLNCGKKFEKDIGRFCLVFI